MDDSTPKTPEAEAFPTGLSQQQILQALGIARKAVRILSFVLLISGLAIVSFEAKQAMESRESIRWPSATGKIVASEVTREPGSGKNFQAKVSYIYHVNGREFRGDRVFFGRNSELGRPTASATVARYPVGAEVKVYYDPDAPSRCVLEPGLNRNAVLLGGTGLLLVLFSQLGARRLTRLIDDFEQKVKTGALPGEPQEKAGGALRPQKAGNGPGDTGIGKSPAGYRLAYSAPRPIEPSGTGGPIVILLAALAAALFFLRNGIFR